MIEGSFGFVWCTYRDWSFRILDGLLDLPEWRCQLIVATRDCRSDLARFEERGIPVMRIDPRQELKKGAYGHKTIADLKPKVVFHYGWSWLVPQPMKVDASSDTHGIACRASAIACFTEATSPLL